MDAHSLHRAEDECRGDTLGGLGDMARTICGDGLIGIKTGCMGELAARDLTPKATGHKCCVSLLSLSLRPAWPMSFFLAGGTAVQDAVYPPPCMDACAVLLCSLSSFEQLATKVIVPSCPSLQSLCSPSFQASLLDIYRDLSHESIQSGIAISLAASMAEPSLNPYDQASTIVRGGIDQTIAALRSYTTSNPRLDTTQRQGLGAMADMLQRSNHVPSVLFFHSEVADNVRTYLKGAADVFDVVGERMSMWTARTALDAYNTMTKVLEIKATLPESAAANADTLMLNCVRSAAQFNPLGNYVNTTGTAQLDATSELVRSLVDQSHQREAELKRHLITLDRLGDTMGVDPVTLHSGESQGQVQELKTLLEPFGEIQYVEHLSNSLTPQKWAQSYVWAEEALANEIDAMGDRPLLTSLRSKVKTAARRSLRDEILDRSKGERPSDLDESELAHLLCDYQSDRWNPIQPYVSTVSRLLDETNGTDFTMRNHLGVGKRFRDILYESWRTIDEPVSKMERAV